ncbi:glycoprotein-N-acetylgalactosamine 3-beta-galactosyltransferase 1-like [Drosophila navojoa]|uniref:glycoprotein-N-acetylgalactosamine 3-beta-galactosyltransferase 1-like n=1 Tax=Drosophila navojoa TaxID=7232 RepID=UPI0008472C75|nr:glycoprotein-N-acetylgalactosamine 3-beta-galactosyltransferase 1-like [Drosophila navojoa]
MSEHKITLEQLQHEQLEQVVRSPARKREELQVLLIGARPTLYRLSPRRLCVFASICSVALIALYAYWDVMMLTALSARRDVGARDLRSPLAAQLEREVRVLCWVMTTPKYHKTRAVHILRTWGKRCNKIYFITSAPDDELDTIVLNKTDSYDVLWGKTKEAFTYFYENKLHEADWFMKADDDTYVFVENMRHMLYPYSPDMPIYFGYNFKLFYSPFGNASYMSGGSGYVLSREALRIFVHGLNDSSKCRQEDNHAEDVEMGVCLYNLGVLAGDSRDSTLRNRFFPMAPYTLLMSKYNGLDFWLFRYAYYNPRACRNCLSDYPVAFHYVSPEDLYVYDYFCYELELYERPQVQERLPEKILPGQLYIPPSDNRYYEP